jgi:transcriptional regulator with GAF, ATPase, and Fis domain
MTADVLEPDVLALLDAPSVGVALLDADLRYVRINELLAAINGVPMAEHLGRRIQEVIPAFADQIVPHLERVKRTGTAVRSVLLEGRKTSVRATFSPTRLGSAAGVAVLCTESSADGLEEHLRFEPALAAASRRLSEASGPALDAAIEASLAKVGVALLASRVTLMTEEAGVLRPRFDWAVPGPRPVLSPIALPAGGHAAWSIPPEESAPDRMWVRLAVGESVHGALRWTWSPGESRNPFGQARVRLFSELIAAALHRQDAERRAADRLRFETLLSEVSTRLLAASGEGLHGAIRDALERLAADRGAHRAYLYELREDEIRLDHEWCAPGVPPRAERVMSLDRYPLITARMFEGAPWIIDDATQPLADDRSEEVRTLRERGITAQLILPLLAHDRLIGALGLDVLGGVRSWSSPLRGRLALVGRMFTNALVRANAEQQLQHDRSLDAVISAISSSFIEAPAEGLDEVIEAALERLRQQTGTVRAVLLELDTDAETYEVTHQTSALPVALHRVRPLRDLGAPVEVLVRDGFSWLHARDLDPLHPVTRAWVAAGIQAVAMLDIRRRGSRHTVLGLHASDRSAQRLIERRRAILADVLGNALARREAERAQKEAYEELARLKSSAERERDYLREEEARRVDVGGMVAESDEMQAVLEALDAVAPTNATVLVRGESGVGKELIARALHARSQRSEGALVKVNCASIPRDLFESEFFGHARGSFTGAHRDRAGRFELADKGTLFLDEVGEIPVDLQAKLLRVLQEGELERVGEERVRRVDVRIVAATNRDLEAEVEAGRFRSDLFYRLSVFPIVVPPLRDRVADIGPLATIFLRRFARELGRPPLSFSAAQMAELEAYAWPGNVRELSHAIERAVILSLSGPLRLKLESGGAAESGTRRARSTATGSAPRSGSGEVPLIRTDDELRALQRDNLIAALEQAGYRIAGEGGAAVALGLSPSTLRDRMRALDIQVPRKAKR